MPSALNIKTKVKPRSKRPRRATSLSKTTANGRAKTGSPKLTNARLRKLAVKNRPPQSWYEDEQDHVEG